jgi:hypothetical protein
MQCVPIERSTKKDKKKETIMKTNLTRTLILAAVALTSAASAFAQYKVAATIPFPFRTFGRDLPAGDYSILQVSNVGGAQFMLRNQTNGKSTILQIAMAAEDSKNVRPRLVFRCGNVSGCTLSAVWLSDDVSGCTLSTVWLSDGRGWKLPTPRLKPTEIERMALIYFEPTKAE